MIRALGFDASTEGAAFAIVEADWNARRYRAHGELADERAIIEKLEDFKRSGAEAFPSRAGGWHDAKLVVGVEIIKGGIATEKGNEGGARKRGQNLIATQAVAHFIRGYASALGLIVEAMPSYTARKHLGFRTGSATDAMVAQAIRALFPTWPREGITTDHHRDAGAVAFAAAQRVGVSSGWE